MKPFTPKDRPITSRKTKNSTEKTQKTEPRPSVAPSFSEAGAKKGRLGKPPNSQPRSPSGMVQWLIDDLLLLVEIILAE